jgi:K+-transporting ATPase ATPase A chain
MLRLLRTVVGLEYAAVAFTILITIATALPLGRYMARVFTGERTWLDPALGPIERLVLRLVA